MVKVSLRLATYLFMFRVAQQCCPGGNCQETSCNNSYCAAGGSPGGNRPEPPRKTLLGVSGGSPDDFRQDIIDGPHGMLCSSIYLRVWLQTCLEFFLHTDRKLVQNLRALSSMHCPVSQGRRKV